MLAMSSSSYHFILNMFLIIFALLNDSASSWSPVKIKLIHFDSPSSPYHKKYDSLHERYERWTQLSTNRLRNVYHHLVSLENDSFLSELSLDPAGIFLASFGVGTPPTPQLLAIDVGSHVTWVTCVYSKFQPGNYSYLKSGTYEKVKCDDSDCDLIPSGPFCIGPAYESSCAFRIKYASNAGQIVGPIVKDTFTFSVGPYGQSMSLAWKPLFGCGYLEGPIHKDFTGTGVLGLSNHIVSVASQFGKSFSYCIGNMHDVSYRFNTLLLGKGKLLGDSTPIIGTMTHIYVNLQSILVDGEVLAINPSFFTRSDSGGGTIIDTGSSVTYLADDAYKIVHAKLKEKMNASRDDLCYLNLKSYEVPEIQFIFKEGAKLILGIDALFRPPMYDLDQRCFYGIKPSSASGIKGSRIFNLIGINAQQYHNIGFDYDARRMYMFKTECDSI